MNRRQFISRSAALLAAGSIANQNLFAGTATQKNPGRVGIQLYSVRNQLPNNVAGTLKSIAAMGYAQVEMFSINNGTFFDISMKEVKDMIHNLGMTISSTHTSSGVLPENINAPEWDFWKRIAEYLNTLDAKWAVQSSLPIRSAASMDDLKRITGQFNRAGEVCKREGVKFAFHNHAEVFGKVGNDVVMEYMIANTDPNLVFYQLDMGHTVRGGGDCADLIRKFPKRIPMWHASDYDRAKKEYVWLGKGNVPYAALFDLAESTGLEVLTVEQETEVDTLTACKADFDYIKQFKWTQV